MEVSWTPEFFWRMFEATGSVWAYVIYRQLAALRPAKNRIVLN